MGEADYDAARTHDALLWVRLHPSSFLRLTVRRVADFWFPPPFARAWTIYTVWAATFLSIPGFFLIVRRKLAVARFLIAVASVYPLMFYIVVSDVRYRY